MDEHSKAYSDQIIMALQLLDLVHIRVINSPSIFFAFYFSCVHQDREKRSKNYLLLFRRNFRTWQAIIFCREYTFNQISFFWSNFKFLQQFLSFFLSSPSQDRKLTHPMNSNGSEYRDFFTTTAFENLSFGVSSRKLFNFQAPSRVLNSTYVFYFQFLP
jgi:hypothetical protein